MRRSLAALLLLLGSAPAAGHANQTQEGRFPFLADGEVFGGLTTWGLVLPVDDAWQRVCEEAIGPVAFFSRRRPDGDILLGALEGLVVTRDEGCSYQLMSGALDGLAPSALVEVNGRLLATTGQFGAANGIFASDDDGESWQPVLAPTQDLLLFQLVANADGSMLLASGSRSGSSTAPALFVSINGGDSFTEISAGYSGYVIARALGFMEDGVSVMISGITSTNDFRVLRAADSNWTAPTVIGNVPAEARYGVHWQDTVWVITPLSGDLYRKRTTDSDFIHVSDAREGPTNCIGVHPDGDRLIGCGRQLVGNPGLFMESTDGATWTGLIAFDQVSYRACPVETAGFTACATYYESNCSNGTDEDFDQLIDCDDDDCARRCAGEGEGEGEGDPGEGEGEPGEGEGEGEPGGCPCSGAGGADLSLLGLAMLLRARSGGRRASSA